MEVILGRSGAYARTLLQSTGFGSLSSISAVRCLCLCDSRRWNILQHEPSLQNRSLSTHIYYPPSEALNFLKSKVVSSTCNEELFRTFSSQSTQTDSKKESPSVVPQKKNIFQKMKQLTRDYWHILIPVHIATSIVWVAIFYTAAKNGVDVISMMEYLNMPEKYIDMIKNSRAGDFAVTYALYKIFTPLRYTVTVGGTTMSIRYLDRMGYLKFGQPGAASFRKSNNATKEKTYANRSEHSNKNNTRKN